MTDLTAALQRIRPVDPAWISRAAARQLELTKPPGSLGRLEEIANRLAAIQETLAPSAARARLVLFAADHGVCAEGVNPFPQAVTAQMVANFLRGGAAVNALAGVAGLDLVIVDAGVASPIPALPGLIRRPIASGTANFCLAPAMTGSQALASLSLGIEMAGGFDPSPHPSQQSRDRKGAVADASQQSRDRKRAVADASQQSRDRKRAVADASQQSRDRKRAVADASQQSRDRKGAVATPPEQAAERKGSVPTVADATPHILAAGEMGIANTTAASALTAALTGLPPAAVVGRGAGADEACMARKLSAIERALALHAPHIQTPLDLLTRLGGFEIGAMCGLFLGAAANRSAALVDGFIATAAAALAVRFCPAVRDYLIPAHRSTEPGHAPLLALIGHRPLLDLEMRLGEGTGAALAVPIVRAAVAAFTGMATFASAGVAAAQDAP